MLNELTMSVDSIKPIVGRVVIGEYLSEFPAGASYSELMDLLYAENWDDITPWFPYQDYELSAIAELVEDLAFNIAVELVNHENTQQA